MTDVPLCARQQRHRWRRERGKTDPDPTGCRMLRPEEGPQRLDPHIGRENEEADGHELLSPALRRLGIASAQTEAPHDDESRQRLDQRVKAEADQCNRRRGHARSESDRELHEVPRVATPGEQPCASDEPQALPLGDRLHERFNPDGHVFRLPAVPAKLALMSCTISSASPVLLIFLRGEKNIGRIASTAPIAPIKIVGLRPIADPSPPPKSEPSGITPCTRNRREALVRPRRWSGVVACIKLTAVTK